MHYQFFLLFWALETMPEIANSQNRRPYPAGLTMETTFQHNMEHSKATKTIYFDRCGDVRIFVHDTYLVVSSETISLVSGPWRVMLKPHSAFNKLQPGNSRVISLPEDDLQTLTTLLHITHLQFNKVPRRRLDFEQLVALAVLTISTKLPRS